MHRCINDCFSYCTAPDNISTTIETQNVRNILGELKTRELPVFTCPHTSKLCHYHITQSQLRQLQLNSHKFVQHPI